MKILSIDNQELNVKSTWNELSKEDLLEVCRVMLLPILEEYKRCVILGYFTDIAYKELRKLPQNTLTDVLAMVDYLFKPSKLTINHFPEIGEMKGPEPGLTNFTLEQYFNLTESYYYISSKTCQISDIDCLINAMYNYNGPDTNKEILKKLSNQEKLAIFYFYEGSSEFVKYKFRPVFDSKKTSAKADGLEFVRMVNMLNNNDVSRNEAIKSTNLYEALTFLEKLITEDGSK